jgi:hypothetical protein
VFLVLLILIVFGIIAIIIYVIRSKRAPRIPNIDKNGKPQSRNFRSKNNSARIHNEDELDASNDDLFDGPDELSSEEIKEASDYNFAS